MPQGKGTYGKKRGRPPKKKPIKRATQADYLKEKGEGRILAGENASFSLNRILSKAGNKQIFRIPSGVYFFKKR